MADGIHILGIRHHGPGSARSVRRALDELQPDCVLIEGPPDADDLIPFVTNPELIPPVALLIHAADQPSNAVYYPFAEFSPEWQALRWAREHSVAVRFCDLPQSHRMALLEKTALEPAAQPEPVEDAAASPPSLERDPLQRLAEAAGFDDGERWWEHVVESHPNQRTEIFAAIREAMAELRLAAPRLADPDEPLREAWMRRTIREAKKQGHASIAVVCGAWHTPALDIDTVPKSKDDELLKGLAKIKTAATWIPWTYDRLTWASGYGAGIRSPGWYEHLWKLGDAGGRVLASWMTRVAHLLREKDIDCSSAHVIEAVRLGECLAAMRGRPLADLSDIADATRAVFCFESDLAMRLMGRELLVGIRLGEVPADVPAVPLQQDLLKLQKRLRLKPDPQEKPLDLDLRSETDRERSTLLHRLRLLGIHWGTPATKGGTKGTFRESWLLRWEPGYAVLVIEAATLGNTVQEAAAARLIQLAREADNLRLLIGHLQDAMLADLGDAASALVRQIENVAALSSDVSLLMDSLPPLASLLRYGNVRETDEQMVRHMIDSIVPRITAGLGGSVASLNDDAAAAMEQRITATDQAVRLIESAALAADWNDALARLIDHSTIHGLIRGRCARLLLDVGRLDQAAIPCAWGRPSRAGTIPRRGHAGWRGSCAAAGCCSSTTPGCSA